MKTYPKFVLLSLILLVSGLCFSASAQTGPLTYPQITSILTQKVPNKSFRTKKQKDAWLIAQVEKRGVSKPLTNDRRKDLREAGASDALLDAIEKKAANISQAVKEPIGPLPSTPEIDALLQSSIKDFTDAVEAGDFAAFRETTSKPFKAQFTAEKFNTAFQSFIDQKVKIVPLMRSITGMKPKYSSGPVESTKGKYKVLNMSGVFETAPLPTKFELQYIEEDGTWKLIKIEIRIQK